jgi:tetratricopeptide (TPR) repeat protein
MPSHIFTRLGYWNDSVASNRAARAAAHAEKDIGEELHAMDYLTYAYLQLGREQEARQIVDDVHSLGNLASPDFKVSYAATAMPVRFAIERRKWDEAAALQPLAQSPPHVAAIVYWARAVASARGANPHVDASDLKGIEDCLSSLRSAGNTYWSQQVENLGTEAQAWSRDAEGRHDEAVQLMRAAADAEDALEKLPVTPGPIIPAREQLGEMLLEQGRAREALQEYQAGLRLAPRRRAALTGALRAAELAGDTQAVVQLRAQLNSKT